jgi:hypothetical protein
MMGRVPRRALAVLGALVTTSIATPAALGHVIATPAFLPSESTRAIDLAGPNEREDPMTGFKITAPAGLVIEHAHEVEGWDEAYDDSTATWTGGSLEPDVAQTFGITLAADVEPGVFELTAEQLYPDGEVLSWPVPITVTPSEESPSQNLALAGVVGLIGVLLVVAVAMLAWRRKADRALQEK